MMVTMGRITKNGEWKGYDYIPFPMLRKQWQTVVLKFIRRYLKKEEKKRIQSRLQKAFSRNGEGFYVYAPKQRGKLKEQLRYIGRYIRRPAIGMNRIEEYDGQFVTFKYIDKKDGKEKHEVVTVEEFISRLIRHIPDEQFKTIRYYGMYSRRSKKISKKLLTTWQKQMRKWVVKVQKVLHRQTWRERIIASGEKDPMICPHCGNYYEYMGEVCLEDGKLSVKIALSRDARIYMERMIDHITGYKQETKKRKEEKTRNRTYSPQETVRQLSLFDVS